MAELEHANSFEFADIIKEAIDSSLPLNGNDSKGKNILHYLLRLSNPNDKDLLKKVLSIAPDTVNKRDKNNKLPLQEYLENYGILNSEILEPLLDAGLDVNFEIGYDNHTLLHELLDKKPTGYKKSFALVLSKDPELLTKADKSTYGAKTPLEKLNEYGTLDRPFFNELRLQAEKNPKLKAPVVEIAHQYASTKNESYVFTQLNKRAEFSVKGPDYEYTPSAGKGYKLFEGYEDKIEEFEDLREATKQQPDPERIERLMTDYDDKVQTMRTFLDNRKLVAEGKKKEQDLKEQTQLEANKRTKREQETLAEIKEAREPKPKKTPTLAPSIDTESDFVFNPQTETEDTPKEPTLQPTDKEPVVFNPKTEPENKQKIQIDTKRPTELNKPEIKLNKDTVTDWKKLTNINILSEIIQGSMGFNLTDKSGNDIRRGLQEFFSRHGSQPPIMLEPTVKENDMIEIPFVVPEDMLFDHIPEEGNLETKNIKISRDNFRSLAEFIKDPINGKAFYLETNFINNILYNVTFKGYAQQFVTNIENYAIKVSTYFINKVSSRSFFSMSIILNDIKLVTSIIDKHHPDLNTTTPTLVLARSPEMVDLLTSKGAKIDTACLKPGQTILMCAALKANAATLKKMVEKGAQAEAKFKNLSAFSYAVRGDNFDGALFLLEKYPEGVNERQPKYLAPLSWAISGQREDLFEKVLTLAGDRKNKILNEPSGNLTKQTPLQYALWKLKSAYHDKDKEAFANFAVSLINAGSTLTGAVPLVDDKAPLLVAIDQKNDAVFNAIISKGKTGNIADILNEKSGWDTKQTALQFALWKLKSAYHDKDKEAFANFAVSLINAGSTLTGAVPLVDDKAPLLVAIDEQNDAIFDAILVKGKSGNINTILNEKSGNSTKPTPLQYALWKLNNAFKENDKNKFTSFAKRLIAAGATVKEIEVSKETYKLFQELQKQ